MKNSYQRYNNKILGYNEFRQNIDRINESFEEIGDIVDKNIRNHYMKLE